MQIIAARDDRCRLLVEIDLHIPCLERINVKSECVKEIGQFTRSFKV